MKKSFTSLILTLIIVSTPIASCSTPASIPVPTIKPPATVSPPTTKTIPPATIPSASQVSEITLQYYNSGKTLAKQGNYEQAILEYAKAIELSAGYSVAHQSRGEAYFAIGAYDSAIKDYTRAIELTTGRSTLLDISVSYLSYIGRAEAYSKQGNSEMASADKSKAAEKRREFEKAFNKTAEEYQKLKQAGEALQAK